MFDLDGQIDTNLRCILGPPNLVHQHSDRRATMDGSGTPCPYVLIAAKSRCDWNSNSNSPLLRSFSGYHFDTWCGLPFAYSTLCLMVYLLGRARVCNVSVRTPAPSNLLLEQSRVTVFPPHLLSQMNQVDSDLLGSLGFTQLQRK